MANLATLQPPKKGEIRNPKGKTKGVPNRSTIARKVLEMIAIPPEQILANLKKMYPVVFAKKSERWCSELIMTMRIAQRAMLKGDVQAYNALMDSAYGKPTEPIDLTSGGQPLGIIILPIKKKQEQLEGPK